MRTYTTDEVAQAVGVSYRRLDYWITKGYLPIPTHGTGVARRWTQAQVTRAAHLMALVDAGLSPYHASQVASGAMPPGPVAITLDTEAIATQLNERLADATHDAADTDAG